MVNPIQDPHYAQLLVPINDNHDISGEGNATFLPVSTKLSCSTIFLNVQRLQVREDTERRRNLLIIPVLSLRLGNL